MLTPNAVANGSSTPRKPTPHNVPNAALVGAIRAFAKPPANPTRLEKANNNGALAAGKSVKSTYIPPPTPPRTLSNTSRISLNSDRYEEDFGIERREFLQSSESLHAAFTISGETAAAHSSSTRSNTRSPSFRAANPTVAKNTSRPSPSRKHSPNIPIVVTPPEIGAGEILVTRSKRRAPGLVEDEMENHVEGMGTLRRTADGNGEASIPSAKLLAKKFEQRPNERDVTKPPIGRKPSLATGKPPPIVAPKPQRTLPIHSVSPELEKTGVKPSLPKRASTIDMEKSGQAIPSRNSNSTPLPIRTDTTGNGNASQQQKPSLPPPLRASRQQSIPKITEPIKPPPLPRRPSSPTSLAPPQPKRLSASPSYQIRQDLPFNPNRPTAATYQDRSIQRISPHITGDSLANAMVGANLALRKSSPPKSIRSITPPPLPPPRRKGHHHLTDHLHRSRSLSPVKRDGGMMMQSLRPEVQRKDEKLSKHKYRPQPNKHHEGTRERWRDELTEEELKRFEGVWAANKGLYIDSDDPSAKDDVQNLVVRDIWGRSDLPPERLAAVWRLVMEPDEKDNVERDRNRRSRLGREEFVVGMWLIDQCLNGRNLPHQIPLSVWSSVRLRGVTVKLEGRGADGRKLERGTFF